MTNLENNVRIFEIAIVAQPRPRARTCLCIVRAIVAADEAQAIRFAKNQYAVDGDTIAVQDSFPIFEGSSFPIGSRMIKA